MAPPLDPAILSVVRRTKAPTNPAPATNPLGGLLSNPLVVQAGLARDQALGGANAALRQQRSQALIGFGSPELANDPRIRDTLDPNTASAAQANPYSILAQLGHQNTLATRTLLNTLAGHGLLRSGATGYQQGEQARAYGQATNDATSQLLAQLNGYLQNYLGTSQTSQDSYTQALLAAFAQMGANPLGQLG